MQTHVDSRFILGPFVLFLLGMLVPVSTIAGDVIVDPYYEHRDEVERGEFSYDDSQDIPWIENETEVLALPRQDDLVPVTLDTLPPELELLIDKSRITVGEKDRVIRLWVWVRSKYGAENASFEGYRCETREYKVYAYANPNRKPPVSKAKRPRWLAAKQGRTANYRAELLQDYFCSIRGTRSPDEIAQAMNGVFEQDTFFSN